MRLLTRLFLLTLFAAIFGALAALWYAWTPVTPARPAVEFDIPAGATLRSAARILEEAGIPIGARRFELLGRALHLTQKIQAGSYALNEALSPYAMLMRLTSGDASQSEFRLIEGWNIVQLRAALDASPDLRHDSAGLGDAELIARLGLQTAQLEGMFFPDTYLFPRGSSDLGLLRRAHHALQKQLERAWDARVGGIAVRSAYEALILASIVEKETGRPEDRSTIAGVLDNRLRIGMRLQADPTVIYGLGAGFDGNLRKVHLLTDGPYNSYTRAGLPPTPIAMPGLASLVAATQPARTQALYYVGRGDGGSRFSRTLDEHNRAVTQYQKLPARKAAAAGRAPGRAGVAE